MRCRQHRSSDPKTPDQSYARSPPFNARSWQDQDARKVSAEDAQAMQSKPMEVSPLYRAVSTNVGYEMLAEHHFVKEGSRNRTHEYHSPTLGCLYRCCFGVASSSCSYRSYRSRSREYPPS